MVSSALLVEEWPDDDLPVRDVEEDDWPDDEAADESDRGSRRMSRPLFGSLRGLGL